ncbi:hypothetical protein R1T43_10560 [Alteromonas sp. CI.11.F.A3]|uniref:hypothetical protein n=1 Tax=Alteromonas sp. CI.11.F.A3 TaxID=3079555 RepID=UPI0029421109|nr:hypothetical protein [Alteromonas sp. CI.11.F.A3]WOI35674.1 hypothetical protein R1T43_10560 [Alteromonas sp. CI.11.F.A3]
MPIKKWIFQYSIAFPLVFALLSGIQYIKGHTLSYSVVFGITWSFISVAIFATRRAYNFKKNIDCQLCNDLNQSDSQQK